MVLKYFEAVFMLVLIGEWNFCPAFSLQKDFFSNLVLVRKAEKSNYFIKEKSWTWHHSGIVQHLTGYRYKLKEPCDEVEGKLKILLLLCVEVCNPPPSQTAFSSDTGYSDYPVWHFRRIQFSESINHSSSERDEAQGRYFRLGKMAIATESKSFWSSTGIFLVQEIIFVDWDIYPLKHLKFFLDQYRCPMYLFCPKD